MLKFLLKISVFFVYYLGFAQNPSYFTIGDNELHNAHVYSILETKERVVYVATNQGLYFYHNGRMKPLLNAQNQLSISLFNLVENSKGEVFCFNLNGQIFKILNNKLLLYFTIPKPYLGARISIAFDENDNLIIASKHCIIVDKNQEFKIIYRTPDTSGTKLYKLPNGKIILITRLADTLLTIENQKLVTTLLPKRNMVFKHFFLIENQIFGLSAKGILANIFENKSKRFFLQIEHNYEFVQFSSNEIWLRSEKGKVFELKLLGTELKIQSVFDETYISKIFLNQDKTLYLGTFEKGVYVVPNRSIKTYSTKPFGNIVSYLTVTSDDESIYQIFLKESLNFQSHQSLFTMTH